MINSSAIECDLLPMDEYNSIVSEKKKFGRYHKTNFWDVKGYGQKNGWSVSGFYQGTAHCLVNYRMLK